MKPVKLSDLIEAVEFESPDYVTMVDLEQGRVVTVEESVLRAVEEGDQELLNELADWQKEELEIARAIAEDSGERFNFLGTNGPASLGLPVCHRPVHERRLNRQRHDFGRHHKCHPHNRSQCRT